MKRLIVAGMLVASVMLLGACGNTGSSEDAKAPDVDVNQQVETEDKDALSEETENQSGTDISSIADSPVITIDLPEDIPVADEDGEIPGADGEADFSPEIVTFGRFYQDADGNELAPIEWMVLDEKDGYSLLLTRQIIASKGWVNEGRDDITWEETDLRQWLDNDFYNTAFTAEEQGAIATFDTTQLPNPWYDTPAGNSTLDKVSLLSYQELVTYMPTDAIRQTTPTAYAIAQGCYLNPEGDSAWWLRSPGPTPTIPEHLASWGNLGARTHYIDDNTIGVRPVLWVKTSSLTAE
jgi:predicted small lipoprotein YifL